MSHKWVRRSKILSGLNLNMVLWDPVQKQEIFFFEGHRSTFCIKMPFFIGHPPHLHINCSLHVCRRVQRSQIFKQNSIISICSKVMAFLVISLSPWSPHCPHVIPIAPRRSPCGPHGFGLHPMLSLLSPHRPCHPHIVPIAPRRSPCGPHGCGLCGLHRMWSPSSPSSPHHLHHPHVILTSSRRSSHHPQPPRYPLYPPPPPWGLGGPESVKMQ